jgi:hypothetical protein
MANTSKIYVSQQGLACGVHAVYFGDTDLADQLILDTSVDLAVVPTKLIVEHIFLSMHGSSGGFTILVEWNDATDVPIIFAGSGGTSSSGTYEYHAHGYDLIVSPTLSGATGDIFVTTSGMTTATEGFSLSLLMRGT